MTHPAAVYVLWALQAALCFFAVIAGLTGSRELGTLVVWISAACAMMWVYLFVSYFRTFFGVRREMRNRRRRP
jgi:cbb3-type cytochrome oxidase subunit 1